MTKTRHICPNGCADENGVPINEFTTPVHVMQIWRVNTSGEHVDTESEYVQTTHPPNDDNIWSCVVCNAEAITVEEAA